MPKIKASLENTKTFIPIEADWYQAKVNGNPDYVEKQGKAPQLVFSWELINNAHHNGRKINFDNCIVGGKNDKGEPYSLNKMLSYLDACEVMWSCGIDGIGGCGAENTAPPMKKKGSPDYHCPTCGEVPQQISFMSEEFQNKIAMLDVGLEDQMTKDPSNPNKLIKVVDDDGVPQKRNTVKRVRKVGAVGTESRVQEGNTADQPNA